MSLTNVNQRWWRWLFWPAVVILAVNIENVATTLGLDKLLTTRWPAMTKIATAILSDDALHIALFVAGGGAFAWGSHILRKMDSGIPGIKTMGLECSQLAEIYEGKIGIGPKWFIERQVERKTERLNRRLGIHEIMPVPFPDMSVESSKLHVAQYLHGLSIFLSRRDLEGARKAGELYLGALEAVGFVPRPLPHTEGELPSE